MQLDPKPPISRATFAILERMARLRNGCPQGHLPMSQITSQRRLFAPISPPTKRGTRWIDYTSIRYNAREARKAAGQHWPGGWPDLLKKGWRIGRVDVVPHEEWEGARP